MLLQSPNILQEPHSRFPRMSNFYQDQLVHWQNAYEPRDEEYDFASQMRMQMGHKIEEMVIENINELYPDSLIHNQQKEVKSNLFFTIDGEKREFIGHIDGLIDVPLELAFELGYREPFTAIFECKSTAFFNPIAPLPDRYVIQANLYAYFLQKKHIVYAITNRTDCKTYLYAYEADPYIITDQLARVKRLQTVLESTTSPELEYAPTKYAHGKTKGSSFILDGNISIVPHPNNSWFYKTEVVTDDSLIGKSHSIDEVVTFGNRKGIKL